MFAKLQTAALVVLSLAVWPFSATSAATNDWSFDYEEDGRIKKLTGPGGWQTAFEYQLNYQDRITQFLMRHDDDLETIWDYDDYGRLVQMTDQLGTTRYDYDGFGRLTSVRRSGADPIHYSYDSLDRLSSMQIGDDWRVRYGYDFLGKLETIATPAGEIRFEHNPNRNSIRRSLPNGIQTHWEFRPDGNLGVLTHADRNDRVMARYKYDYRANGQIASVTEWSPRAEVTHRYEYDAMDRLVADHSSAGVSHRFEYDKMGHRTRATSSSGFSAVAEYTPTGLIDRYNGASVRLDDLGNITSRPSVGGKTHYAYDARQHLREVSRAAAKVSYKYDGLGRVTSRSMNGQTTTFLPDPLSYDWRPLVSRDPIGGSAFYVHSAAAPLARITGQGATFFLEDQTGSIRLATDDLGKVTGRFDYDPFGRSLGTGFTGIGAPDLDVRPAGGGSFYDKHSGLYLSPFGIYDPFLGRDLQPNALPTVMFGPALDPIGTFSDHSFEFEGSRRELIGTVNKGVLSVCNELTGHRAFGAAGLGLDVYDFYRNSNLHPGDPALWAQGSSAALGAASLLATGLTSATLGAAAPLVGLGHSIGTKIRSRVLQNRTLGLVDFPLGVAGQTRFSLHEQLSTHSGSFHMSGNDAYAYGGWHLSHRPRRLSVYQVNYGYKDKILYDGALATGFHRKIETRTESGGTITTRTVSRSQTTYHYSGAAIDKALKMPGNFNENLKKCYAEHPPSEVIETFAPSIDFGSIYSDMDRRDLPTPHKQWEDEDFKRRYRPFFDGDPPDKMGGGPFHSGKGGDPFGPGSPLSPANVGGVYLSGVGRSLEGLGTLRGVAVDPVDGRLTLLSRDYGEYDLPAMRLDDLVTIFRTVYNHGRSPSVSIDPNPQNPRGPRMNIAHGPGTQATYPGWVLFECDRVMKCYSLGAENLTGKTLVSNIDGYSSVLDQTVRNGGRGTGEDIWERFWIVPAKVKYQSAPRNSLTLADVALKVRTQRMEMKNGKLEPAPDGTASKEAQNFASWFGDHFADVAREYRSEAPQAIDGKRDVDVFAELHRIALVAAIAENLRDQGVPMPAWMNDYQVEPFEMPESTPSITVTKPSARYQHSIFGGVRLSPEDKVVQRVVGGSIGEESASGEWEMDELARRVGDVMREVEPLQPKAVELGDLEYRATALPGADTRGFGACRLSAVDLRVTIQRGAELALSRHYHSFFSPRDATGPAWTFDFPRLVTQPRPVRREGDYTEFDAGYHLTSPLGSYDVVFRNSEVLPGYDVPLVVPDDAPEILGVGGADRGRIGEPTAVVLFRDGREWHFRDDGALLARSRLPVMEIFRRDPSGRIHRIEGWYGEHLRADMVFHYGPSGELERVVGSDGSYVEYTYDGSGLLTEVRSPEGRLQYRYRESQVVGVRSDSKPLCEFIYDERGRILQERQGDGPWRSLRISKRQDKIEVGYVVAGRSEAEESVTYDDSMHPERQVLADGRHVRWSDRPDGSRTIASYYPDGRSEVRTISPDRRSATVQVADGGRYAYSHDSAGRLLGVRKGDRNRDQVPLLSYEWDRSGVLTSESYETCTVLPQYREDGLLDGLVVTGPNPGKTLDKWAQLDFDEAGRPAQISDCWGRRLKIGYDRFGQPSQFAKMDDDGKSREWISVTRDGEKQVSSIETSWGYKQSASYDSQGQISRFDCSKEGEHFTAEYLDGRPLEVRKSDGSKFVADYYREGRHAGRIQEMSLPDGLRLRYDYTENNLLASVAVGEGLKVEYTYDAMGRLTGIARRARDPLDRARH